MFFERERSVMGEVERLFLEVSIVSIAVMHFIFTFIS